MPRYFFDVYDDGVLNADDDGTELDGLAKATSESVVVLAEIAKEVLPSPTRREMAIEVLDSARRPLLRISLVFDVQDIQSLL